MLNYKVKVKRFGSKNKTINYKIVDLSCVNILGEGDVNENN